MVKEFITIQNISKGDFLIRKEAKGKKEVYKLRQGCTCALLKENAKKLLELYPLELKDLTQLVKTVESDNSKKLRVELEKAESVLKEKDAIILKEKEGNKCLEKNLASEKEHVRKQEVEINIKKEEVRKQKVEIDKLKNDIKKLEDTKVVKKHKKIIENKDIEIKALKKKINNNK